MIKIIKNISEILTLQAVYQKDGRNLKENDLGKIPHGAIVFNHDEILWVGSTHEIPPEYLGHSPHELVDLKGEDWVLTPELVDSHTHLVFGGFRADEYALRASGVSYQEIAKKGGGILKTVRETRKASVAELFELSCERLIKIFDLGIGTIEIKSGYGLNLKDEEKICQVIQKLKNQFSPRYQILCTYMGAHALPPEFSKTKNYLKELVIPQMKNLKTANLINFVDIFHEEGYFDKTDVELLFDEAKKISLPTKIHADEFIDNGGAELAAKYGSVSADHLLEISDRGIDQLAHSSTVACLLPGTSAFLGKKFAPARKLLDAGAKVAISSDFNPGSSHNLNLIFSAQLSFPQYKMNLCEWWAALTLNAAHALNLHTQGAIIQKMKPRFSWFHAKNCEEIGYSWGQNLCKKRDGLN